MAYPSVESLSEARDSTWHSEDNEAFEEYAGSDRTDPIDPLLRVVPNVHGATGEELALAVLNVVSIEPRPGR